MSLGSSKQPKFKEPEAIEAPAAAAPEAATPTQEVSTGADSADTSVDSLRKKFRPKKGIGATGTGLGL